MSETDSFIDEVSEEVRRDRLYGYVRRYGWIAVAAVVLLVGGAAFNELTKSQSRTAAEAKGDAILSALDAGDAASRRAALDDIGPEFLNSPVVAMLRAGEALRSDDAAAAVDALQAIIDDPEQPRVYRDMAVFKHSLLTTGDTEPAARIATLSALTTPGGTFRVLAEEQIALAELEMGERVAAMARLRALVVDTEASDGLRLRVRQLMIALGEDPA